MGTEKSGSWRARPCDPEFPKQSLRCASNEGDYEEAAIRSEECYALRRRVFGGRHPDTIDSLNDSALLLDPERAEERLRYGLNISRESLGEDHFLTLRTLNNLAGVLQSQGDYDAAEEILKDINNTEATLPKSEVEKGDYNPRPFFTVSIIGHMNLPRGSEPILEKRVRNIFRWLRDQEYPSEDVGFGKPLGLEKTPIVLLSSLAPGSDQLAARIALEEGIKVRCPLPFPYPLYRIGTTFNRPPVVSTISRQADLDELVTRIGQENTFMVTHAEDDREYQPYIEDQLIYKEFRNRRYRAAGEFVAANCDLLITICDQEEAIEEPELDPELSPKAQSGTRIILSSYINGIDPGILPLPPSLSYQENGPVVRIFCPNSSRSRSYESDTGDVIIWHPADAESIGKFHDQIHEKEMGELRLLADRLEKLNDDLDRSPRVEFDPTEMFEPEFPPYRPRNAVDRLIHFGQMFDWSEYWKERLERIRAFLPGRKVAPVEKPLPPLNRLVSFKRRCDLAISRYDRQVAFLTNMPFVMGFLVFLIYEFHSMLNSVEVENQLIWAAGSFLLGGLLLFIGIIFHSWANGWGAFDRKNDYRALIEGTRVQFFWAAAGIRERVPSYYVQRLSGELAWIKSAIGSIILPVETTSEDFDSLETHRDRYQRLKDVWFGWVCSAGELFLRRNSSLFQAPSLFPTLGKPSPQCQCLHDFHLICSRLVGGTTSLQCIDDILPFSKALWPDCLGSNGGGHLVCLRLVGSASLSFDLRSKKT